MKKIVRLIAMGLVASFLSLFGLSGCMRNSEKFMPSDEAQIVSLSIFESNMDRNHSYSFFIYEKNNTVYFSANTMLETGEQIDIEDCVVEKEELEKVRIIAREINLIEYLKNYKKPIIQFSALDAPSYSTSVTMSDGSESTVGALCSENIQLKSFFINLVEKYYTPVSEPDSQNVTIVDESGTNQMS